MDIVMMLQETNGAISVCLEWLLHNEYNVMKEAVFEWKNEISREFNFWRFCTRILYDNKIKRENPFYEGFPLEKFSF